MKRSLRKLILMLFAITSSVMVGCEKGEIVNKKISINNGAFVDENSSEFKTFNIIKEDSYEEIDTETKIINNYNEKSQTYTYYKEGSFFVNYKNREIKIEDKNISHIKISNDGNFVFYFIDNEIIEPVVINLKTNEKININNEVVISGEFIDFISDNSLVFYGVDLESKTSGVFIYNIESKEESLLYNIDNGYVKLLKQTDNKVAMAIEYFDGNSALVTIDSNGTVAEISRQIMEISDVLVIEDRCYIIGSIMDNIYSIYEIQDKKIKRLIYDFPNRIYDEKGLSFDEYGNMLFIGSVQDGKENIYKYDDGSIILLFSGMKNCNFINVN